MTYMKTPAINNHGIKRLPCSSPGVLYTLFPIICCLAMQLPSNALDPQQSLNKMQVADGLEVKLVANEPEIRKPLSITFDGRGRMWVIQYLQYPAPAGLKPVSVDQYLRT